VRESVHGLAEEERLEGRVLASLTRLKERSPVSVALARDDVVGFLGAFALSGRGRRWVYSPDWACAAAGPDPRATFEALYADRAAAWVADGIRTHFIGALANEHEFVETASWLGFGRNTVDAIRGMAPLSAPAGIAVRLAGTADVETVASFEHGLRQHLSSAPVLFALGPRLSQADHARVLSDPHTATLIANIDGEPVGCLRIGPASDDAPLLMRGDGLASISRAFTVHGRRNQGVATALLSKSIEWGRDRGYSRLGVDFETANVLAARFWLKHFTPVWYALARHIEEPGEPP
jgi:GNAT superfamily N-acetyltransferase